MSHSRVFTRRVVSPDGKTVAEVKSVVTTSGDGQNTVDQTVTVEVSSGSSFSNSSTYSYSSSTSSSASSG
jgi:hypothetical protein